MANVITAAIVMIVVGTAVIYIVKEKKRGTKCIGCPAAGQCASGCSGHAEGRCHS